MVPLGKVAQYINVLLEQPEIANSITLLGIMAWPTPSKGDFDEANEGYRYYSHNWMRLRNLVDKSATDREAIYHREDFPFTATQWEDAFGKNGPSDGELFAILLILLPKLEALSIQADYLTDIPLLAKLAERRITENDDRFSANRLPGIAQELLGNRIRVLDAGVCSWAFWGTWADQYTFHRFTKLEFVSAPYVGVGDNCRGLQVPECVRTIQFNHCRMLPGLECNRVQDNMEKLGALRLVRFVFDIPLSVCLWRIVWQVVHNRRSAIGRLVREDDTRRRYPAFDSSILWDFWAGQIQLYKKNIDEFLARGIEVETYFPDLMPHLQHKPTHKRENAVDWKAYFPFPYYRDSTYKASDQVLRIPHVRYDLISALDAIFTGMEGNITFDCDDIAEEYCDPTEVVHLHYKPLHLQGDMEQWQKFEQGEEEEYQRQKKELGDLNSEISEQDTGLAIRAGMT
jgi:hypothetical protein